MVMKEQLIEFKTAKLAKKKGFDECVTYIHTEENTTTDYYTKGSKKIIQFKNNRLFWNNMDFDNNYMIDYYSAPTQSFLQKWLREKHNICVEISLNFAVENESEYGYGVSIMKNIDDFNKIRWLGLDITGIWYSTYEQALEIGLYEALKLIKL